MGEHIFEIGNIMFFEKSSYI